MKTISLRIDSELEKKIEFLMKSKKIQDRSSYLRMLLDGAMAKDLLDYSLEEFKNHRVSLWKAASMTGMSLRDFMEVARSRAIPTINEASIREDIEWVRENP